MTVADITNLVKEPRTDAYSAAGTRAKSWWTNTTPAELTLYGYRDPRGNPLRGLQVGQNSEALQTDIEGVEPGDTVRLYLQIRTGKLHAGLYRDRLAEPEPGDHMVDTEETGTITADLTVPEGDGLLWLKLWGLPSAAVEGTRLSKVEPGAEDDGLGIFDGYTEDTEERAYQWDGDPNESTSTAVDLLAEPEPEPGEPEPGEPGDGYTGDSLVPQVLQFAGIKQTDERVAMVTLHVDAVTAYVYGYTRGRGFIPEPGTGVLVPRRDVERVIVSAAARLAVNPRQMNYYTTGDYSERPAVLAGWTLLERAVLNNYRVRWA